MQSTLVRRAKTKQATVASTRRKTRRLERATAPRNRCKPNEMSRFVALSFEAAIGALAIMCTIFDVVAASTPAEASSSWTPLGNSVDVQRVVFDLASASGFGGSAARLAPASLLQARSEGEYRSSRSNDNDRLRINQY